MIWIDTLTLIKWNMIVRTGNPPHLMPRPPEVTDSDLQPNRDYSFNQWQDEKAERDVAVEFCVYKALKPMK